LGSQLINTGKENINDYKDKLISKYNDIRGQLLQELVRHIRKPIKMTKIYPDNVYSTDFRTLSLVAFAQGLGSDLLNDALDTGSDALLGASDINIPNI